MCGPGRGAEARTGAHARPATANFDSNVLVFGIGPGRKAGVVGPTRHIRPSSKQRVLGPARRCVAGRAARSSAPGRRRGPGRFRPGSGGVTHPTLRGRLLPSGAWRSCAVFTAAGRRCRRFAKIQLCGGGDRNCRCDLQRSAGLGLVRVRMTMMTSVAAWGRCCSTNGGTGVLGLDRLSGSACPSSVPAIEIRDGSGRREVHGRRSPRSAGRADRRC